MLSSALMEEIQERDGIVRVTVRAKPRASRSRVLGFREGALEIAIAAPPVDGAANMELLRTLSKALGVGRSSLNIAAGKGGKTKIVAIEGLSEREIRERLA